MALPIRFAAEPLRSVDFGSVTNGYTRISSGTQPKIFLNPIRQIHLQNLTNQSLMFSFDGITNHLVLPQSGFILLDIVSNKTIDQGWFIAQGSSIFVQYIGVSNPTSGTVYLSSFYGTD